MATLQITVEYSRPSPQVFVQRLRRFCLDRQNSPNCQVARLHWEQAAPDPQQPPRPPPASYGGIFTVTLKHKISINLLQSTDTHEGTVYIPSARYSGERITASSVFALRVSSQCPQTFSMAPVILIQQMTRRGTGSIDCFGG